MQFLKPLSISLDYNQSLFEGQLLAKLYCTNCTGITLMLGIVRSAPLAILSAILNWFLKYVDRILDRVPEGVWWSWFSETGTGCWVGSYDWVRDKKKHWNIYLLNEIYCCSIILKSKIHQKIYLFQLFFAFFWRRNENKI